MQLLIQYIQLIKFHKSICPKTFHYYIYETLHTNRQLDAEESYI